MTSGSIVTVNTGSSSVKLAVFAVRHGTLDKTPFLTISISNIGQQAALLQITQPPAPAQNQEVSAPNHIEASRLIIEQLAHIVAADSIMAIGHRLVHGGAKYTAPTVVEAIPEKEWALLSQLDPQHTPAAQQLISQFKKHFPDVPQIACFDTAFFRDMPQVAKVVPIPQKYYAEGVRRYGFHGLSYVSLLSTFREQAGDTAVNGRVVLAHLGSGASVTAVRGSSPIDTTMGFTPTSGIVMSTRSGDLDPNIFGFLHRQNGMSLDEFDHMVSSESGLLGVSTLTSDMYALLEAEENDSNAALAVELFVRDVKKSIGALAATLGGIDSLIFSGGIGEQSAILRARICHGLEYMGIELDDDVNMKHSFLISSRHSRTGVHVIPANEACVIATETHKLLLTERYK